MNFLIIRGGRKALGPLGSGGSRPGPAPRARPSHPLPGQFRAAPGGAAPARGLLPLPPAVRPSVRGPGSAYDSSSRRKMRSPEPRACLAYLEPSASLSETPRLRGQSPASGKAAGPSAGRSRPPAAPGHDRQSQAGAFRGAAIPASARRDVATPGPRENRLSEPFQSAHNKCARHRMHHLPPQIRALMGRQIALRGGHAGRPVPRRQPACPPAGGTRV
ncbi:translation initiation factor IF-2-like isoform X2 [Vulpes lagopus]|uniref:translation initiation factor IF-2-like isoform X2 n=1 Tax=Vulpes lagopus TaxID=494514 RepID=UPI001BC8DC18|nr:translation initiation factor IF-2-like isoform X2 [Vulpes lagopus]